MFPQDESARAMYDLRMALSRRDRLLARAAAQDALAQDARVRLARLAESVMTADDVAPVAATRHHRAVPSDRRTNPSSTVKAS